MEASRYILKRLVQSRDTQKALEIIKKKYPKAHIITYQFKNKIYDLPSDKRKKNTTIDICGFGL